MERYLIDTNTVSDYFSESLPNNGLDFLDEVINETPNLSVITQIELLCWETKEHTEKKVREFINDNIIFEISDDINTRTVKIRRTNKIKTPDAIIAATALSHDFTLITNDKKDFKKVSDLKILNPHQM